MEYAVAHLNVKDIIVTGHYDCGAIRAAMQNQDLGLIENWLRCIRDVYRLHGEQLDMIEDDEERHRKYVCKLLAFKCTSISCRCLFAAAGLSKQMSSKRVSMSTRLVSCSANELRLPKNKEARILAYMHLYLILKLESSISCS